jgi:hypothetical protein
MNSTNDLSNPLLGNLHRRELEHEQDAEYDEEVCMRSSESIAHESSQNESEPTTSLRRWSRVIYCLVLMNAIGIVLLSQSVKDCGMSCTTTFLLPEILIVIMMCLVHFDKMVAAFLLLLSSLSLGCLSRFMLPGDGLVGRLVSDPVCGVVGVLACGMGGYLVARLVGLFRRLETNKVVYK